MLEWRNLLLGSDTRGVDTVGFVCSKGSFSYIGSENDLGISKKELFVFNNHLKINRLVWDNLFMALS